MGNAVRVLEYSRPLRPGEVDEAARRRARHGVRLAVGGVAGVVALGLFLVALGLVRMGCHETIEWLIDGNHGLGFGGHYFVRGGSVALFGVGAAMVARAFWPEEGLPGGGG